MGIHEDFTSKVEVRKSTDRNFGFVFTVFWMVLGLSPLRHHGPVRLWAMLLSAVFLALTMMRSSLLGPMNRIWTGLGELLARVMNPIVTAVLFFGVITPAAVILRAVGKDLLKLRFVRQSSTYWIEREQQVERDSMSRQF